MFCQPIAVKADASANADSISNDTKTPGPISFKKVCIRNALGIWGVANVLAVLANAIKRLYPVAIQPLVNKDMLGYHWGFYIAWSLYMAYVEGYKAFHLKFSPMVVQRAFSLPENLSIINVLLAGPYSMGLFGASRKRMIVSWSITVGVFALINIVKQLPYPYRSIVDAGVVVGLSLGSLSIVWNSIWAMFGMSPMVDDDDKKRS